MSSYVGPKLPCSPHKNKHSCHSKKLSLLFSLLSLFSLLDAVDEPSSGTHPLCDTSAGLVKSVNDHVRMWDTQIETSRNTTWNCTQYLDYIYTTHERIREEMAYTLGNATMVEDKDDLQKDSSNASILSQVSKASALLSAHLHLQSSFGPHHRSECYTEELRLLSFMSLTRLKELLPAQLRYLWFTFQRTGDHFRLQALVWLSNLNAKFTEASKTNVRLLEHWDLDEWGNNSTHSKADPAISLMRQQTFATPKTHDFAKGILRIIAQLDDSKDDILCEINAGIGEVSSWLNETGWVTSYAYDHAPDIELVTRNRVLRTRSDWNAVEEPIEYDWIICTHNCTSKSSYPVPLKGAIFELIPGQPKPNESWTVDTMAEDIFKKLDLPNVHVYRVPDGRERDEL